MIYIKLCLDEDAEIRAHMFQFSGFAHMLGMWCQLFWDDWCRIFHISSLGAALDIIVSNIDGQLSMGKLTGSIWSCLCNVQWYRHREGNCTDSAEWDVWLVRNFRYNCELKLNLFLTRNDCLHQQEQELRCFVSDSNEMDWFSDYC